MEPCGKFKKKSFEKLINWLNTAFAIVNSNNHLYNMNFNIGFYKG